MVQLINTIAKVISFQLVLSAPIIKVITTPDTGNHGEAQDPAKGPIILNAGSNGSVTQIANSNISNGYYPYRPYYPYYPYPSYYPVYYYPYYPWYWPFPPVNNNANEFFKPPKIDLESIINEIN